MGNLNFSDSIVINSSPEDIYAMVSDISRMGEWSPVCKECWWDEGATAEVGAWFSGRNVNGDVTWETRSEVVVANPGEEFAWIVGGNLARWGYAFSQVDGGTCVTESWEFLPAGIKMFNDHFGDNAQKEIDSREQAAQTGIPATLAALKKIAES